MKVEFFTIQVGKLSTFANYARDVASKKAGGCPPTGRRKKPKAKKNTLLKKIKAKMRR